MRYTITECILAVAIVYGLIVLARDNEPSIGDIARLLVLALLADLVWRILT